jgi:hypothetical protein
MMVRATACSLGGRATQPVARIGYLLRGPCLLRMKLTKRHIFICSGRRAGKWIPVVPPAAGRQSCTGRARRPVSCAMRVDSGPSPWSYGCLAVG